MTNKKENGTIVNRKARARYQVLEELEVGLVLEGAEVKSLRLGRGGISEAFVRISEGEAWVHNMVVPAYQGGHEDYDPSKTRKLLLHRRELLRLSKRMEGKNLALVPLKLYFKHNRAKLLIGLAWGVKEYERRDELKKKDLHRELRRQFKEAQIK